MGLDIGFSKGWEWAPRPGGEFGALIVERAETGEDGVGQITLTQLDEIHQDWLKSGELSELERRQAKDFIDWCDRRWYAKNFEPTDALTILASW